MSVNTHRLSKRYALLMICLFLMQAGCSSRVIEDVSPADVLDQYANIAHIKYSDSVTAAKTLQAAIHRLQQQPDSHHLQAARNAWRNARIPYLQTEAYRFGNPIIDDWEGRVNAWPLDEGLIDYVDSSGFFSEGNPYSQANVIASEQLQLSGRTIDARQITPQLLSEDLHEVDQIESNVATGYHAIEFLLWGQDLNGMNAGAGNRPASDFDPQNCTGGHCQRRNDYLNAVTALLISDLEWMTRQWQIGGAARAVLLGSGTSYGLAMMLHGLGSFSLGELAGERIKLGLMLRDPEEETDCFSDNTHQSLFYNALGVQDVYLGQYHRLDGQWMRGASLSDLVQQVDPELDRLMRTRLETTQRRVQAIVDRAEHDGVAYDQMLSYDRPEDNRRLGEVIKALESQTQSIEKTIRLLGLDSNASNISSGTLSQPMEG